MTEKYKEGVRLAESLSAMINCNNKEGMEGFISTLQRDHRTLQYDEIRLAFRYLKAMSEVDTDARNEYAVNFTKKVVTEAEKILGGSLEYI